MNQLFMPGPSPNGIPRGFAIASVADCSRWNIRHSFAVSVTGSLRHRCARPCVVGSWPLIRYRRNLAAYPGGRSNLSGSRLSS